MRWIGSITCFCWNLLNDKGAVLLWGGVFATGGHHVGCALVCANERCAVRCYEIRLWLGNMLKFSEDDLMFERHVRTFSGRG